MSEDGAIRVLLVDDHRMVADALSEVLAANEDIELLGTASRASEAIAMAAALRPDVVLMDYQLPDQDGVAATRAIKEKRPGTRVVMLTSFDEDAILVAAIEAGCSGFVTKQGALEEVVAAVRLAGAGEAVVSPDMLARLLPHLHRVRVGDGSMGPLTPREREVLELLAEGISNRAIAERLVLSVNTVRNHVQSVLSKLGAHSKLEAVTAAVRDGLIRFPR